MAKKTVIQYVCDRCGSDMEKPYYGGESGTYTATFQTDYSVTGNTVKWSELCMSCNEYIGDLISSEMRAAKMNTDLTELDNIIRNGVTGKGIVSLRNPTPPPVARDTGER